MLLVDLEMTDEALLTGFLKKLVKSMFLRVLEIQRYVYFEMTEYIFRDKSSS
ncbi:hypothetical protein QG37_05029 [Candidozyma auris]|uniref:Uncharacterized protein n=1 Tax=Candidozyma auris TaxID=498019 RepID=A0A0L0NVS3_CANAR|nr:hypothetical protein QG37_05029 [[Candida] auris]